MDQDELLRGATAAAEAWQGFGAPLDDSDLFTALAMEADSQSKGATALTQVSPLTADDLTRPAGSVELGKKIFQRWNQTLHDFACNGDDEDKDLKQQILAAITGKEGAIALVAGAIVTAFGLSLAMATIIATLITRLIIVPVGKAACEYWGESLAN